VTQKELDDEVRSQLQRQNWEAGLIERGLAMHRLLSLLNTLNLANVNGNGFFGNTKVKHQSISWDDIRSYILRVSK
jgi:hypothetical protein